MINFADPIVLTDFILGILLLCAFLCLLAFKIKKTSIYVGTPIAIAYFVVAFLFDMKALIVVGAIILLVLLSFILYVNASEYRYIVLKNTKYRTAKRDNGKNEISLEETYKRITEAVKVLSKQKIGAIITIEKDQNLDAVMKNGTIINAPVTSELLMTIFYPGTRLHDGAVIIRGNTIVAASVYYSPTTKALQGKFGSRHRAAVGISETTDAVTIVVSEETGIISIAYKAKLEHVSYDLLYDEFTTLLKERE